MKPFAGNESPTVGIEQEFHVIDPATADLVPRMEDVWGRLTGRLKDLIAHELFLSVLESRSDVAATVGELIERIASDRAELAGAAERAGVLLAAAGSHPFARWDRQAFVEDEHYQWVREHHGLIVHRMLAFGLHVHVGVRGAEAAIYVMNEMRRWAFPLLALSANSPFHQGRPSGLASTRCHLFHSMPRTGLPPEFASFAELEALYEKLLATGDVKRPGDLWWSIRPQPPLGTVEFRLFDLPTDVRRIGALVAVTQAAVAHYQDRSEAGVPPTRLRREYLDQNAWKAMRYDFDADLLDAESGEVLTIREQLGRLLDQIAPRADRLGSGDYIAFARRMLADGSESQWQVRTADELGGDLRRLELDIARRTLAFAPLAAEA